METERLVIRNFQMSDVERCFENWGQDQSLGKYLVMFPMIHYPTVFIPFF